MAKKVTIKRDLTIDELSDMAHSEAARTHCRKKEFNHNAMIADFITILHQKGITKKEIVEETIAHYRVLPAWAEEFTSETLTKISKE